MLDFNIAPYFDDTNPGNDFYRVLFTPGKPVQTRELNALQSILQQQVRNHGDHVFKNGAMVIPGHLFYDKDVYYVRLVGTHNGVNADVLLPSMLGKILTGQTTGVKARVVHYEESGSGDPATLFVKYMESGDDGDAEFQDGEVLLDTVGGQQIRMEGADATGKGSICTIGDGIYYISGIFCRVARQTIVLEKYSDAPSYRVGLDVVEDLITEKDDESLYDNALGYSNYAAPGAHRYKITLDLIKLPFETAEGETTSDKFVDLLQVKSGEVIRKVKDTAYSELEKMFAKRTYDESGDYEVIPFGVQSQEYRNNSRGAWVTGTVYLLGDIVTSNGYYWEARSTGTAGVTAPALSGTNYRVFDGGVTWQYTASPDFNQGLFAPDDEETLSEQQFNERKIAYQIYPGKAYIRGFETELQSNYIVVGEKAREYSYVQNNNINVESGTWIKVSTLNGLPNINSLEKVNIMQTNLYQDFSTLKTSATATYTVTGGVITSVTITNPGCGYDRLNPPSVTAAVGTGAVLKAVVGAARGITEIKIVDGGTGYSDGSFTIDTVPATEAPIGTCRIRSFEFDSGTIGTADATYKLQISDIEMVPGFTWELHAGSLVQDTTYFKAQIYKETYKLEGLVSTTNGSKTVTGVGTYFLNELSPGQHIMIDGNATCVGDPVDSDLSFVMTHPAAADGSSLLVEAYTTWIDRKGSLFVPFPKVYMRNVRDTDDLTINTSYSVKRRIDMGTGSTASLTVPGETFANPNTAGSYVFAKLTDGTVVDLPVTRSSDNKQITITRGAVSEALEAIVTINKTLVAAKEKVKTLKIKTIELTNFNQIESEEISLTEADAVRILSVKISGATRNLTGDDYDAFVLTDSVDITEKYQLLTGQTPYAYGISKIRRHRGMKAPENAIQITFEYYDHSDGDYFSIDSYVGVPYSKIPVEFRDMLDFRPRIADNGVDYSSAGKSVTEPIALGSDFTCDYSYYLPRRDKITISTDSFCMINQGVSGYGLQTAPDKDKTLVIAEVTLAPYTIAPGIPYVDVKKLEHKRYTMKDIGKLEKRIENLEYYTQLSLLEKNTIEQKVTDQNGLERYKAGIMVDQFSDQTGGDVLHYDYQVAIDEDQLECRAFADIQSVTLVEKYLDSSQKLAEHYMTTGNVVTLPYSSVAAVSQLVASDGSDGIISCNPYSVIIYKGTLELHPKEDFWMEDQRLPTVTNNVNNFASTAAAIQRSGVLGTQWNSWQTTSVSTSRTATPLPAISSTSSTSRTIVGAASTSTSTTAVRASGVAGAWGMSATQITSTTTRPVTTETTTTTTTTNRNLVTTNTATNQTRTGTTTSIGSRTTSSSRETFDINFIPWIRSRPVVFIGEGLKPNTRMYAFFDGVDVTEYCLPLEEIVITYDFTNSTSGDTVLLPDALDDADEEFAAIPSRRVRRMKRARDENDTTTINEIANALGRREEFRRGRNNKPRTNTFRGVRHGRRHRGRRRDERRDRRVRPMELHHDRHHGHRHELRTNFRDVRREVDRPRARRDRLKDGDQPTSTVNRASFTYEEGDLIQQYDPNTQALVATAVVVEVIDQVNSLGVVEKIMKIVNRSGPITATDLVDDWFVTTPETGVTAKVLEVRTLDTLELRTNSLGVVMGEFMIPNREDLRFPIGTRKMMLTDDPLNRSNFIKTASTAEAEYHAMGQTKIRQTIVTNTTVAVAQSTPVSQSRTLNSSSQQVVNTGTTVSSSTSSSTAIQLLGSTTRTIQPEPPQANVDPVAQTFRVIERAGIFATGLTVYFTSKPSENIPAFCQLKEVVNGYPGSRIYASGLLFPDEVDVFPDSFVPLGENHTGSTFKFETPVYLEGDKEYCVVVGSTSGDWYVRCAKTGTQEFGKPSIVTQQPFAGSLFTSQNNSTWTSDQDKDLTFILHKAKFDISQAGNVTFTNQELEDKELPSNALFAVEGSNKVRVYHSNHGFMVGDKVTIAYALKGPFTGITGDYLANALSATEVEATYVVADVEYDYYTIEIKNSSGTPINAAYTAAFGGSDATTTYQIAYSTLMPSFEILDFDDTDYRIAIRGTYGDTSIDSPNAPYSLTGQFAANNKENVHFIEPMVVATGTNEIEKMAGEQSFEVTVNMTSFDENLSPVVTLDRAGIMCVRNKINNPTAANTNISTMDDIVIFDGTEVVTDGMFTFNWDEYDSSNHYMETDEIGLFPGISKLHSGKYISLETPGAGSASVNVGKTLLITRLVPTIDTSGNITNYRIYIDNSTPFDDELITADKMVKLVLKDRFVHELSPEGGTCLSTYVSSPMHLVEVSTGLRLTIDVTVPLETNIEVWYRTLLYNGQTKLVDEIWSKVEPQNRIIQTNEFNNFTEVVWEVNDLKPFDLCQAKVLFKSDNNALTPRIRNFRMMALA